MRNTSFLMKYGSTSLVIWTNHLSASFRGYVPKSINHSFYLSIYPSIHFFGFFSLQSDSSLLFPLVLSYYLIMIMIMIMGYWPFYLLGIRWVSCGIRYQGIGGCGNHVVLRCGIPLIISSRKTIWIGRTSILKSVRTLNTLLWMWTMYSNCIIDIYLYVYMLYVYIGRSEFYGWGRNHFGCLAPGSERGFRISSPYQMIEVMKKIRIVQVIQVLVCWVW